MSLINPRLILAIILLTLSHVAYPVEPIKNDTENKAYIGLVWQVDKTLSFVPALTLGFQSMQIDANRYNNGADISMLINLQNPSMLDSLRMMYIGGERNIQFNLGGGYSFAKSMFFGSTFLQIPYARFGTNYFFNSGELDPKFEINSLGQTDQFRECPYQHYVIVPVQKVVTIGGQEVIKTFYTCVKVAYK